MSALANVSANVIAYLESGEYDENGWQRGLPFPLIDVRDQFAATECRDMYMSSSSFLCTGDGFRWTPDLPRLRFP